MMMMKMKMKMKMEKRMLLLLLLGALLSAAAVRCREAGWRSGGLRVMSFQWKNCSRTSPPAALTTLTLSPDPIVIPGDLAASASGQTSVELTGPLTLDVVLNKNVVGIWVPIPCLDDLGSCRYSNVCGILEQLFPPWEDCPEPLRTYGLPCRCPFKAGSYSLPLTNFTLPRVELPSWLTNGDYRIQGSLLDGRRLLGCLQVALSLESN